MANRFADGSRFQPITERVHGEQMTRLRRRIFDLLAQLHDPQTSFRSALRETALPRSRNSTASTFISRGVNSIASFPRFPRSSALHQMMARRIGVIRD